MNTIAGYYIKQLNLLDNNLNIASAKYDEVAVHNMRLSYKRLKALYKFIKSELEEDKLFSAQLKSFKNYYKCIGRIREMQVNKKLTEEYSTGAGTSYDNFILYLNTEIESLKLAFTDQVSQYTSYRLQVTGKKVIEHLDKISEERVHNKIVKFVDKKLRNIEFYILNKEETEKYHTIRKLTKEIYFIIKLIHKTNKTKEADNALESMKSMEESLGRWHDNDILIKHLQLFIEKQNIYSDRLQYNIYKALIEKINKDQEQLINDIDIKIFEANLTTLYCIGIEELEMV